MNALPIIRILLGPVLLFQGARVRRNIIRMAEPNGPRAGTTGAGPACRVLILGDSSAAGVGADNQAEALSGHLLAGLAPHWHVTWQLFAKTGWTTGEALAALASPDGLGDASFDIAVICLGVNDATTEVAVPKWLETYDRLLARLHRQHGVTRAYLCGLPPMQHFPALPQPLRWYMGQVSQARDRALGQAIAKGTLGAELAPAGQGQSVIHVPLATGLSPEDIASDGFHPGPRVYQAIGSGLAARLLQDGPPMPETGPDTTRSISA